MKKIITLVLTLACAVMFCACGKSTESAQKTNENTPQSTSTVAAQQATVQNYNLVTTSNKELSDAEKIAAMTEYSYAKTENYIPNSYLKEYVGKDTVATFANVVTSNITDIYSVNARTIRQDADAYKLMLGHFISDDMVDGIGGERFVDAWTEAVLESDAVTDAYFTTGEDFVYADGDEIYVRGILTFKVISATDLEKLNKMLPVDVEIGAVYNFVYDIGFYNPLDTDAEVTADDTKEVSDTDMEQESQEAIENEEEEETTPDETDTLAEIINLTGSESSNVGKIDYIFALGVY